MATRTQVLKKMGKQALEGLAAAYATATMDRILTPLHDCECERAPLLFSVGHLVDLTSVLGGCYTLMTHDLRGLAPLAVQVTTNAASSCYELYRKMKYELESGVPY